MSDATLPIDADVVLGRRYRLVRRISAGPLADAWEGRDEVLGRAVAVKVLDSKLAADPATRRRFRDELLTARLNHPHLVATYDAGWDRGSAFVVRELVQGRTLAQVLSQHNTLTPGEAVHLASQVAEALACAHQAEVVHGGLTPTNIFVCPDWQVKVADFGVARATDELARAATDDEEGPEPASGSLRYLAPEQLGGGPPNAVADVYALGAVLYEMLAGRPPFRAGDRGPWPPSTAGRGSRSPGRCGPASPGRSRTWSCGPWRRTPPSASRARRT